MAVRDSLLITLLLGATACSPGPDGQENTSTTEPITGAGDTSPSSSSASSSSSTGDDGTSTGELTSSGTSSSTGDSSTTGDPFTTGTPPDFGDAIGCGGKIDLMFVIDRDVTMEDEYPTLKASLPLFLETIKNAWDDFDVHIMTVAADTGGWGIAGCDEQCLENNNNGCAPLGPDNYPCWGYEDLDSCDAVVGAGVTFPAATGAANERCEIYGGNRYIIGDDPDLEGTFECVTNLGVRPLVGSLPAALMTHALSSDLLGPGQCNEGFLRSDAILVIIIVTDTYDSTSPGEPEDWATEILNLKNSDQGAIVVGLINPDGYDVDNPKCDGPGDIDWPAPLVDFLGFFENALRESICAPSFAPFFAEAADIVVETCNLHTPE